MATGLIKGNSIIGVEVESTEGTYVAPSAVTSYIQPLEDGFEMSPAREQLDRNILDASPGKASPKMGMKSVSGSLPCEFRASGTEGAATDFDYLVKSALGSVRSVTSNVTSTTGHTSTVINMAAPDAALFSVGDVVIVKASGAHELRPISAVGATSITFPFALTAGAPANGVVLSKVRTYYPASTGHPSLSLSYYWGNEIREAAIGAKVTNMALEGFQTGQLASLNFGFEGLTFTQIDGAAPHTPSYDSSTPPVILSACVWRAGVDTPVNAVSLSLSNTLGYVTSTCSANGKIASRVTQREITGSINPYKDDTSVTYFNDFVAGTEFSLFLYAYNPSSTTGEITMGSAVAIWLPQCVATEQKVGDQDGILTDEISFKATRGSVGTSNEMYMCFI